MTHDSEQLDSEYLSDRPNDIMMTHLCTSAQPLLIIDGKHITEPKISCLEHAGILFLQYKLEPQILQGDF